MSHAPLLATPRPLQWAALAGAWAIVITGSPAGAQTAPSGRGQSTTLILAPVKVEAAAPAVVGGGKPAASPCLTVDVAGHQTGPTQCAAQKLQEAARAARAAARSDPRASVPSAYSGDTQVGVANATASSQRLGTSLVGATRLPQRPSAPPPATSLPRTP